MDTHLCTIPAPTSTKRCGADVFWVFFFTKRLYLVLGLLDHVWSWYSAEVCTHPQMTSNHQFQLKFGMHLFLLFLLIPLENLLEENVHYVILPIPDRPNLRRLPNGMHSISGFEWTWLPLRMKEMDIQTMGRNLASAIYSSFASFLVCTIVMNAFRRQGSISREGSASIWIMSVKVCRTNCRRAKHLNQQC